MPDHAPAADEKTLDFVMREHYQLGLWTMNLRRKISETKTVRILSIFLLVSVCVLNTGCRAPMGPANKVRAAYAPGAEKELKSQDAPEGSPFFASDIAALEKGTARIQAYTAQMESGMNSPSQTSAPSAPAVPAATTYAPPTPPSGNGSSGAIVGLGTPSRRMPGIGSRQEGIIPIPDVPRIAPGRDPAIGL